MTSHTADTLVVYFIIFVSTFLGVLCLCGLIANVLNMATFSRIGFKDSINVSLFGVSLSDFGVCFTSLLYAVAINPLTGIEHKYPIHLSGVTLMTIIYPNIICFKTTYIITSFIVFERCLCVALPIKVKLLITPKRSMMVIAIIYALNILSHAPVYYARRLQWVFDPLTNKSIYTITNPPLGRQIIQVIYYIQMFFNMAGAYIFVTVCTLILLVNLISQAKWRRKATNATTVARSSTTTISSKRTHNNKITTSSNKDRKLVQMVLLVSALFIFSGLFPLFVSFGLVYYAPEFSATGSLYRLYIITHLVSFVANGINATFNIAIYYNTSTRYRATLNRLLARKG